MMPFLLRAFVSAGTSTPIELHHQQQQGLASKRKASDIGRPVSKHRISQTAVVLTELRRSRAVFVLCVFFRVVRAQSAKPQGFETYTVSLVIFYDVFRRLVAYVRGDHREFVTVSTHV